MLREILKFIDAIEQALLSLGLSVCFEFQGRFISNKLSACLRGFPARICCQELENSYPGGFSRDH